MIYVLCLVSYLIGFFLSRFLDRREEKVHLPALATEVARKEGKKRSVNVAQINEILKIYTKMLAELSREQRNYIFHRYQ